MGLSKDKPDGISQLKALVDLLVDLEIVKPTNESTKSSESSHKDVKNQSAELSVPPPEAYQDSQIKDTPILNPISQLVPQQPTKVEEQDSQIKDTPILNPSSQLVPQQPTKVEEQQETANSSILPDKILAREDKVSGLQSLQSLLMQSSLQQEQSVSIESELEAEIEKDNPKECKKRQPLFEVNFEHNEDLETPAKAEDKPLIKSGLFEKKLATYTSLSVSDEAKYQQEKDLEATAESETNSPSLLKSEDIDINFQQKNDLISVDKKIKTVEPKAISSINIQQKQDTKNEDTNDLIVASSDTQIDEERLLLERLQRLLVPDEILGSRELIVNIKEKVTTLENHIYEPAELTNLLLPLITEILTIKVADAREEVVKAIAPVIDGMIQAKTQQDKVAISSALAPLISDAVAERVNSFPGEIAEALAPEIGIAIKQQIALERDAMVDALYPVIGSIIAKYMTEVLKAINEKVETAVSVEGFLRKFRAKIQGVSDAELMLQEATPFIVKAIFLIHKASGLVISEAQSKDDQQLESEMVAGMLTAIRSFVNDCIAQTGDVSEIDQINYGKSKIILEVAGYCYLAVVIQGKPPKSFMRKIREALARIIQSHGKAIELFDGDPENVPTQVSQLVGGLTRLGNNKLSLAKEKENKPPVALLAIVATVISLILIPWGIFQLRAESNRRLESDVSLALASEPELAVYHLTIEADGNNLKLAGKLPNQYLRTKAEEIAKKVQPKLKINNAIIPVKAPVDQVLAMAEVKRLTAIFNQIDGVEISSSYDAGKVTVEGSVLQIADTKKITQAFEQIPGVESVTNTVQLQTEALASRIYFERASSQLKPAELAKIIQLKEFFKQYPKKGIKILGHSDSSGTIQENQRLAIERAKTVRDVLVNQGIDTMRLQVAGTTSLPRGVDAEQPLWLSRCVEFEIITP